MADEINGKGKHLGGKIKEGVGDLLGDREMEREGRLDQMEGRAEQDQVRAEEAMREANARRAAARNAKELNDL
ncbi:MAG TPA: CsbD family protein [Longimicrobiaceae bacterium]|nr:CsbD family protein [Longimicrobiaceae bacterium]